MTNSNDMTPRDAAQKLGIRLDAIYALIWAGRLAARKVEGRWLIPATAVEGRIRAHAARRDKATPDRSHKAEAR